MFYLSLYGPGIGTVLPAVLLDLLNVVGVWVVTAVGNVAGRVTFNTIRGQIENRLLFDFKLCLNSVGILQNPTDLLNT